jgi:hypothetical protein
VVDIGIALNPHLARANAFCRAVTALGAFGGRTIELYQDRIINVGAECAFNGL